MIHNRILDLEALHLLPIINKSNGWISRASIPTFLAITLSHSSAPTSSWRANSRFVRNWLSRIRRNMMPRYPSREPNSRDSAEFTVENKTSLPWQEGGSIQTWNLTNEWYEQTSDQSKKTHDPINNETINLRKSEMVDGIGQCNHSWQETVQHKTMAYYTIKLRIKWIGIYRMHLLWWANMTQF